jgi:hypothetical protein
MLGDLYNKKYTFEFLLAKPNGEEIAFIQPTEANINIKLKECSELNLVLPKYYDYTMEESKAYSILEVDFQVVLYTKFGNDVTDIKRFIITEIEEQAGDTISKSVTCLSYEHILSRRLVRNFSDTRRLFTGEQFVSFAGKYTGQYDKSKDYKIDDVVIYENENYIAKESNRDKLPTDTTYWQKQTGGILDYIQQLTYNTWTFKWINDEAKTALDNKYRTLSISSTTILNTLYDLQQNFNCVFLFDGYNKIITIARIEDIGVNRGLFLSDENVLKQITKSEDRSETFTRVHTYGKDNLPISAMSPTGDSFLDDFGYFKKYMSSGLVSKLTTYENLLSTKEGEFNTLLNLKNVKQGELTTLKNELWQLELDLDTLQDNEDGAIKTKGNFNGHSYSYWHSQVKQKQTSINSKQNEINNKQSEINGIDLSIVTLRNSLKWEQNFIQAEIEELSNFIYETTIQLDIDDVSELYEMCKLELSRKAYPKISVSVDSADLFSQEFVQYTHDKMVLGDIVNVQYKGVEDNFVELRIVAYSYDIFNNGLSLELANKSVFEDGFVYLKDLIRKGTMASHDIAVNINPVVSDYTDKKEEIEEVIEGDIDTRETNKEIKSGTGQVINKRGIYLQDILDTNGKMKILDNMILLTKSDFDDVNVAISPAGIVADLLYGTILAGASLDITNESGSVTIQGDKLTATDVDIVLTNSTKKARTILSKTGMIKIQKGDGTGLDTSWIDVFYVDNYGNVITVGTVITGETNGLKAILNQIGLSFYDNENQKEGWAIVPNSVGGQLKYYVNDTEKVFFGRGGAGDTDFRLDYSDGNIDLIVKSYQAVKVNGNDIATKTYVNQQVDDLQSQIDDLWSAISSSGV